MQQDNGGGFACDESGCIARISGRSDRIILIANTTEAMVEDCAGAAIVGDTARGWRKPCDGPQLIVTPKLLHNEGAIEARLNGRRVELTSVARQRGDRPWAEHQIAEPHSVERAQRHRAIMGAFASDALDGLTECDAHQRVLRFLATGVAQLDRIDVARRSHKHVDAVAQRPLGRYQGNTEVQASLPGRRSASRRCP